MRLKQLKLAGFKSFANPTTFHFPKTITAIVGPNGCGKSNVIDAIRWVLGESSAKQLRGGAMSDVIFAGTQDKSAKSLASVELVFEHTQGEVDRVTGETKGGIHHALNLYHELAVRRQITKDGKSDYFINGTKVRRRDVVDVFLGTGLGARSYAVIEQGMIGRIIDANALQLREFIEEASGVSRYQSRRDDTQKQLTTASDNLSRLNDMASELTIQQQRLEKQAKTAQLAQNYQQQSQSISERLLTDDYTQAWQKQRQLEQDFATITAKVEQQQANLANLHTQHHTAQQQIDEQNLAYQNQQNLVQRQWQQHFETQSLVSQSEQNIGNDEQRLTTLNFELSRFVDYQNQLNEQKQQAESRIANLPDQLDELSKQINELRDEQHTLKNQRQTIAQALVGLNQQKQHQEKQLAVSENAISHHTSQQARHAKREQEHQQAMQIWQTANAKFKQEFDDFDEQAINEKLSKLADTIERTEARIIARQEELADQSDEVESLTRQHRQAEQQRHTWQTEQATLQNLLDKQQTQFKQVVKNTNNNNVLPKLLSQLALTEQGKAFANVFDTLVSVFAQWAIAEGKTQNWAEEMGVFFGRNSAEIVPNPTVSPANFVALTTLIQTPVLPIFQHVFINLEPIGLGSIDDIIADLPFTTWLIVQTLDSHILLINSQFSLNLSQLLHQDGNKSTVNFSQQFTHQSRIDELEEKLAQQKPQLDRLANALQEASISLQEWQAQDRNARQELLALTQQKQRLHQDQLQHEHRYQSALSKLQHDKHRLDNDTKRLSEESTGFSEHLATEQAKLDEVQQALAELQPQLQQQISERQRLDERLSHISEEQRTLEQQHNRLTQTLATGQLQISASQQQLAKAEQDKARLTAEHKQLAQRIAEQHQRLPVLQRQLSEQTEQLQLANDTLAKLGEMLKTLESDYQTAQTTLQNEQTNFANLQQQHHSIDTALALARQNVGLIGEQLMQRNIHLETMTNFPLLSKAERKQLQAQNEQLKAQISELGAVNHTAVAELEEVNSRLMPLAEQITDLTASIDKLTQAIRQIDSQTKALFMNMLDEVNKEMNHLFTQVFGGGQAQLVLSGSDHQSQDWQSGLELMAQPKGKKNSRLALLSGGEKTLTALSLIFAIFKQQPAPFCVLDEVDAPLDDANVARFTNLIMELAKDVQFIFISHNKLSMQIADELKGVTMPTAGVSKLVSVDMSEVAAYLEQ